MYPDDRYRRAAATCGVGVWDWNLATGEIYVDPVLKQLLGYEDHEIRNHLDDWGRHVHPDDAPAVFDKAQAHIKGETPSYEAEHRMLHRDGSIRWFLARGSCTRDEQGTAVSMAGTDTDITERKRSEEALRQAEELNRRIVDSTDDCVKILDLDGRILYMNPVGLSLLGSADIDELMHRTVTDFFEEEPRQAAAHALEQARRGGHGRFQYSMRTASGLKWFDAAVTPITDANGAVVQLLAVSRDVSDRRREEAFRAAQHRVLEMIATGRSLADVLESLVHLVESQADGMLCSVVLLDEDGATIRHGAAPSLPVEYVRAIDGSTIGPSVGSCGTAMHSGATVIVTDILTDPLWEGHQDAARLFGLRACWSTPIFSPQRKVLGSFAMYYDEPRAPAEEELRLIETAADIARIAIEQQRAYHALRHSEARNEAILRAIPDMMFVTTVNGVILDYHAKDASKLYVPPSAFLGRSVQDVLPAWVAAPMVHAFARASVSDAEEKVEYALGADDQARSYEASIVRCGGDKILSIVRDITARKRAELEAEANRRELAHLSRVAMLGELSGALAHELSQPLTAVLSNAQAARHLLERHPADVEQLRAALDDIIRNDKRAGAVIDRLRTLLRKGDTALHPLDVNDVARDVMDLADGELMSRRVTVKTTLAPGMPLVQGDRVQLQQVVLNLVLNACDAMTNTDAPDRQLALSTSTNDGFVELVVSDRGTGIPEGQLERVFEPFVTFRQQGLGLGLAISRSIVTAHGGSIRAENNADGGATFRCLLPIAVDRNAQPDRLTIQGAKQ
jgi:PAS domain S-box-containing protein